MATIELLNERMRSPRHRTEIGRAVTLQQRLRFHTETRLSPEGLGSQVLYYFEWVKSILPKDKYAVFRMLFRLPSPVVCIVEDAYRELERVFDSKNASSNYSFTSRKLSEDWMEYRKTKLREPSVWRETGWKKMQVSPCSVLVVDLPTSQSSERPEPYWYWLEISDVIDYEMDGRSETDFEWIAFRQPLNRVAVFDKTKYILAELNDKGEAEKIIVDTEHGLGYCPARFFWSVSLNANEVGVKKNPITKCLGDLDHLLFHKVSKRHLDTYAAYPIYTMFEHDCDYRNNETGDYCDGGFLRDEMGEWKSDSNGNLMRCPKCSGRIFTGPGSVIEIPKPNSVKGTPDMSGNAVKIVTIDRESLDYNTQEEERLEAHVKTSIVGADGSVQDKEAINETQVAANFESKTTVLRTIAACFESAQEFVESTICRLRYGDSFLGCSISWGTEFYIFTIEQLYDKLKLATESGAPLAEIASLRRQIREAEYRNNPAMQSRMELLEQIEPYLDLSIERVTELYDMGLIDKSDFQLKLNFESYILRFERENTDIVEFGNTLSLNEKVSIITKKLKEYVSEQRTIEQTQKRTDE